jgi:hypothetical protein
MARYNSVNTTTSVAGGTTISTPSSGLLTTLTGTGTVTIPNPILYTGQTQTFYNSTGSAITLNTPSGNFTGAGASGNGNLTVPGSSVVTVVSDGANYIVQAWIGGTITVGGTLTANGAVAMNPTGLNVSIQPTGAGTLTLSSGITGTLDNINIGSTIQGTGNFTTLSANGTVTFTANTAATAYNSGGALQVTGGVGIGGAVFVNNSIKAGSASSTNGSIILQGNYGNGSLTTFGTEYSSGGPSLGYAVYPSSSAAGAFLSASGAASLQRAAYNMNGNTHNWYAGAAQTVAIGSSVSMYNAMSLSTTALTVSNAANVVIQTTTSSPVNGQSAPGYIQLIGLGWNTLSGSTQYQGQIALGGTYSGSSGSTEPAITFSLAGTGNSGYNAGAGPTALTERVRITNYGLIGVGTTTPLVTLDMGSKTDAIALPKGTAAQRPTGATGYMRYNTDGSAPEYYNGSAWIGLGVKDGTSFSKAALKSTDILLYNPSAPTGWYWLQINNIPTQVYIDNVYNGGGWVLVATHTINVSIPTLTYVQTTVGTTQLGSSGFTVGTGDPKQYTTLMPLKQWTYITTANAAGNNFVYFTAGSQVELGNTGAHSRRSRWTWTGWSGTYAWQGTSGLTNEVGGTTPGLWTSHASIGLNWSTYDNDQDTYSGNCSSSYNNAPWWYDACWDGNFWGGNGSGYQNAAFWTGSGSDYYNYGAFYVK